MRHVVHGFAMLACMFLALSPAMAAAPHWPASGEIVFEVLHGDGGMKLGEGVHRWRHDGKRYEMSSQLETTGLTAVFLDFQYSQQSEGVVLERGLQPRRFVVEQRGRETESATFDWSAGSVLIERRKGRKETAAIATGDLDVLSVWHLASLYSGKELPGELTLVSNRGADVATLEIVGPASVDLPVGKLDTLHVRLRDREGRLAIDLWLSKAHSWVPVRILMKDRKGQVLDQRAITLKVDAPTLASSPRDASR